MELHNNIFITNTIANNVCLLYTKGSHAEPLAKSSLSRSGILGMLLADLEVCDLPNLISLKPLVCSQRILL
jgi:hypothetical protein